MRVPKLLGKRNIAGPMELIEDIPFGVLGIEHHQDLVHPIGIYMVNLDGEPKSKNEFVESFPPFILDEVVKGG